MSKKQQPKPAKRRASAGERIAEKSVAGIESIISGLDDYCQRITTGNLPHSVGSLRGAIAAIVTLYSNGDSSMSKQIDRAIRAAVKEAWFACENHESENSESHKAQIKGQIEQRFGVKL